MIRLLLSRIFSERSVWALPTIAFALTSGIGLMVFGGAMYFYTLEDPDLRPVYGVYASAALILLLIPMFALMSSAARLLARRRDERLSTLRLLGAGAGQLRGLVLAEAGLLALAGVALGTVLYVALLPVVGLLPFAGERMGAGGLWLGPLLLAASCAVMLLFALTAAFLGLRRVRVTPLGVRTRQSAQQVWRGRAVLAAGAVVVVFVLHQFVPFRQEALVFAVGLLFLAVPLLAVQVIGPWVLKVVGRVHLRRAGSAERLIAARSVLESPQQMWRQVGGVAVAAFIGVIAGSGIGLLGSADQGHMGPEELTLLGDLERGVVLTLAVAFLMTACSVALNQTAQILDQRALYAGMARMGMTFGQLHRIRRLSVTRSLTAVLGVAVAAACIVALPIVGYAVITDPMTVGTVAAVLLLGIGLIRLGMLTTRPALRRVVG